MTARRLLLALPAATALAVLPACGSDDDVRGAATTAGSTTGGASSSSPNAVGGGTTAAADVELEDQSGDGTTVQVARVSALEDGFVVITLDEDDGGQVLGWSAVAPGVLDGAQVDLDTPVPAATGDDDGTEITATLYADTDGDGAYSAGDVAVAEPQDGDGDDDDVVDDDADYRVA
ncbi:MAG: hypothetical protein INR72_18585 [Williamsia herbipolensis]|nr:hypothetical protein [Williamsia herbipolensis]